VDILPGMKDPVRSARQTLPWLAGLAAKSEILASWLKVLTGPDGRNAMVRLSVKSASFTIGNVYMIEIKIDVGQLRKIMLLLWKIG
jgi:hypothetical protein